MSPTRPQYLRFWPLLIFFLLACLLLWPVILGGQVFVPATLLRYLAPWQQEAKPVWNPLMYDSVGQFYPWRHFASEELHSGRIPLWNPYQFCGTPFVANSQSAVFYPGNLLFWLLPTAQAAGLNVLLHLCLAAAFTYLFLRSLGLSPGSSLLGGVAFAFSGWQVSWLALPTFLCTSCWLPLILLCTKRVFEQPGLRRVAALGGAVGCTLLAGHLQVAFYILLATIMFACWLLLSKGSSETTRPSGQRGTVIGGFVIALVLGGMLACAQFLPSFELSKQSHRAIPPSAQGYEQYAAYAVHSASIVTLFLPNYYGNPSDSQNPYSGASKGRSYFNYAEGAMYVGIPTILLASYAVLRGRQIKKNVGYFGGLALLALLLAMGTFVDALLYFYLPGFGQSGSPGRALVLWSFALSCLAALGYEKLVYDDATPVKTALIGIVAVALLFGAGLVFGPNASLDPEFSAKALFMHDLPRQLALFVLSAGAILALASGKLRGTRYAILPVALVAVDLLATGTGYNLTSDPAEVYPAKQSLTDLKQLANHDRIMPVNQGWSFVGPNAVLPPNGAMVFRLHDVQGYDSLFPGQYKAFMNELSQPASDSSPPEVGNMVFAKNAMSPMAAQVGVKYILSTKDLPLAGGVPAEGYLRYELPGATGRAYFRLPDGSSRPVEWIEDSGTRVEIAVDTPSEGDLVLSDQAFGGWRAEVDGNAAKINRDNKVFRSVHLTPGKHTVRFRYEPVSFRLGLYLACAALLCLLGLSIGYRAAR